MANERQISLGPLIGLVGALLLLVSLFLDWYDDVTAWTVFEVWDVVLALLALGAISALADRVGFRLVPVTSPVTALALPLGVAAFVIVASQLINEPPAIVGTDEGPELGIWLGLAGTLLLLGGALLSVARISLALDTGREGRAGRPGAADPDAPTVRAPEAPATGAAPDPERPRTEPPA